MKVSGMAISRETAFQAADAVNIISDFVAYEQVRTLTDLHNALFKFPIAEKQEPFRMVNSCPGVVVLCPSAVLSTTETVLSMVKELVETSRK